MLMLLETMWLIDNMELPIDSWFQEMVQINRKSILATESVFTGKIDGSNNASGI